MASHGASSSSIIPRLQIDCKSGTGTIGRTNRDFIAEKKYLVATLLIFFASPASSIGVQEYESLKLNSREFLEFYVQGLGDGYLRSSIIVRGRGDAGLYCPPMRLALNSENYIQIIDKEIANLNDSELANTDIGFILYDGLVKNFPCSN